MNESYSRSREKAPHQTSKEHWEVEVRNLPENLNKEDVAFFLWKSLESCHGLIRNGNPVLNCVIEIIQLSLIPTEKTLRLNFRSEEEAVNCLQLNRIYFGKKVLFITSRFLNTERHKALNLDKLKIVKAEVEEKFRQIYIGNLPHMTKIELVNYLSEFGELKSFIDETKEESSSSCLCEYINDEQTEEALKKLDNSKLKGRSVIAKRSSLMKTKESKTKMTTVSKGTKFESLDDMFLTFDIEGFFKTKKISCVLLLKEIIPFNINPEVIIKDVKSQVDKIGPLVRVVNKNQNLYLEYEDVKYSQIAYLLISKRKYDGKNIEVLFYDPIKFADDILV